MEGSRRISRVVSVLAAVLASSAGLMFASGHVARAASGVPGFGQPTPSGIVGDGFEQDVALDDTHPNQHIVYSSAPVGTTTGISNIWRSLDGGQTFKFIPATIGSPGHPTTCPAGGGDSELAVDSAGHLYFADLYLGNFSAGRSDDQGTSFAPVPSCNPIPTDAIVDRQWYTTQDDPTTGGALFLVYDRFLQAQTSCPGTGTGFTGNALVITRSPDFGGLGSTAGNNFTPSLVLSCDEGIMGNDKFFNFNCASGPNCHFGKSPEVFVVQDNNALNRIMMNRCDVITQTVTNVQGLTNCVNVTVSNFPGSVTGANFPTMAIDKSGEILVVWEQASGARGAVTGNTELRYSFSTDMGSTWTAPAVLPTAGVLQHVMAWPAAGDPGRFDIAYYGTSAPRSGSGGPDSTSGDWNLYLAQTLDNGVNWTNTMAGEHFIHRGTMQTLIGNQSGNRDVGDFLKVDMGPQGEANISYSDNNSPNYNSLNPQAFFIRQNSGPGLLATQDFGAGPGMVNLPAAPPGPCVNDSATNDATLDTASMVGANNPNLDITQGCLTAPDASNYRVTMNIANLSSLGPDASAGGSTNIWQAQWHVPSTTASNGGALFMAYAESVNGGTPTCWVGQASQFNAEITYPGTTQLPSANCQVNQGAGTITITVPKSSVTEPNPLNNILYSVAFSSQTVNGNAEDPGNLTGGQLPNLIDPLPAFDFNPDLEANVPEAPWAPAVLIVAGAVTAMTVWRRRARGTRGIA